MPPEPNEASTGARTPPVHPERSRGACLLIFLLGSACAQSPAHQFTGGFPVDAGGWLSLFNGTDFSGWDKYLGKPTPNDPPLGLNNDPRGVFTVVTVDGEQAIQISGEVWGALVSKGEYGSFDLHAEYKWGTRTWPPLNFHDSGIMYLTTGPYGAVNAGGDALSNPPGSGAFQVSLEYQLFLASDIGGLYNLGPIQHILGPRNALAELPGVWNEVEIHVRPTSAEHFLNGTRVASATGFQLALPGEPVVPLTRGRLQLQSEGGEIYLRRIRIHPFD